ncbi:hypothetical protein B0H10DRAFT_2433615 [Mycena sp. CBHHK59/15]|nr:hypothetical protein B0H10DRAFT_2444166 [Mycena sp. CBHHK59/15]KAJ6619115.1 hypothetical protein B0H10DRAFT_2433615 [Mycena sp. CBHHK59/15]
MATLVEERIRVLNSWESCDSGKTGFQAVRKMRKRTLLLLRMSTLTLDKYFPRRERAFIRALLDADYKRLKPQISRDVILFMHAYPNTPDTYFVHFDYTHFGSVVATVRPRSDLVYLPAWYRRTRLHVVFAARGKGPMPDYLVPLLSSSTAFDAGLHRIANEIPAGADISLVENKVWELIQATTEVVEIH